MVWQKHLKHDPTSANRVSYREVDADYAGQRVDNFLLSHLKGVPRSHVYQLVRSGQVRVNSGRVSPSYRLKDGDRVRIPPVRRPDAKPVKIESGSLEWLEQRIVYEDRSLMLIDKPAGMAVHGGSGVNLGCIEALRIAYRGPQELELVHRLDKATSGCLLVAKRRSVLRTLHRLLRENSVKKRYVALVRGRLRAETRRVDLPLTIDRHDHEARARVDANGRAALSFFRPIQFCGDFATLVEVTIATGRTHQIRAHAAHIGHPVAGDDRYGDKNFNQAAAQLGLNRMFLHASSLAFEWPDEDRSFGLCIPLPEELRNVLRRLA